MKKLLTLAMVLAFAAISGSAFADHGPAGLKMKGFYQIRAIKSVNTTDGVDSKSGTGEDTVQGTDQRVRLWFEGVANEKVKGVFALEMDTTWGNDGSGTNPGKVGSDGAGFLEVKNAYIDAILDAGQLKAGVQPFVLNKGYISGDDATGISFAMNNGLNLTWIKHTEGAGNAVGQQNDVDFYAANYKINAGDGITVTPMVGVLEGVTSLITMPTAAVVPAGSFKGGTAYYAGAEASIKAGDIKIDLMALMNQWELEKTKTNTVGKADGGGQVLYAKAAMGPFYVEAAQAGDKDNTTGDFVAPNTTINFSEIVTGGMFDSRTSVSGTRVGTNGDSQTTANYEYVKVGYSQKYSDTLKVSAAAMMIKQAEKGKDLDGDNIADKAISYGNEIDVYVDYTVLPNLVLTVGGGYLMADDNLKGTDADGDGKIDSGDDVYKTGVALTLSF